MTPMVVRKKIVKRLGFYGKVMMRELSMGKYAGNGEGLQ